MLKIGFVGAGNMAQAMMQGWSKLDSDQVSQGAYTRHHLPETTQAWQVEEFGSAIEIAMVSDMLVLATPPTALEKISADLKPLLEMMPQKIIVSVLGGISLDALQAALGEQAKIVRALPNVNVAVGQGYTAMHAGAQITAEEKGAVFAILAELGRVDEMPEADFGAVSAVAGSGPAFVAGFIEALTAAGQAAGLDEERAVKLSLQTFRGTLDKMVQSDLSAHELAQLVMTPGGSTAAGWETMQKGNLNGLVSDVIQATMQKNAEFE